MLGQIRDPHDRETERKAKLTSEEFLLGAHAVIISQAGTSSPRTCGAEHKLNVRYRMKNKTKA